MRFRWGRRYRSSAGNIRERLLVFLVVTAGVVSMAQCMVDPATKQKMTENMKKFSVSVYSKKDQMCIVRDGASQIDSKSNPEGYIGLPPSCCQFRPNAKCTKGSCPAGSHSEGFCNDGSTNPTLNPCCVPDEQKNPFSNEPFLNKYRWEKEYQFGCSNLKKEEQGPTVMPPLGVCNPLCGAQCTCDVGLFTLIHRVVRGFLGIAGAIALLAFVYAGVLYLTAGGAQDRVKLSIDIMKYALIGIGILLLAYTLISTYFRLFS